MAAQGHEVTLVVADANGPAWSDGVRILDVGICRNRLGRMLRSTRKVIDCAVKIDADIYVLHDPELLPHGARLIRLGKKVVFDSHEDVATQVFGKPYLNSPSAWIISRSYLMYEKYVCRRFNGVVGATPTIRDKFQKINAHTVDINNFPILEEFDNESNWSDKAIQVCYIGNITVLRGIRELVHACTSLHTAATLKLAGTFDTPDLAEEVKQYPGWARVVALGHQSRQGISDVLTQSMAGLVTLHPQSNYLDALPVKMFEYMAAGIPVIASHFPRWRAIIDEHECGICVNPVDPASIAEAIDYIVTHPDHAKQMGKNGRRAVTEKYNWRYESKKLLDFYDDL
jgi:glycosyltransferase involved in cell wall biosynthesis